MNEIKQKALEKMLVEMNDEHSNVEDTIHNWLCNQKDVALFEGILKEDRSIKGSIEYCISEASKVKIGNAAMVDDQTVFDWIKKYFISEKIEMEKVAAKVVSAQTKPKTIKKSKKITEKENEGTEQISLFDFI